MTSLIDSPSPAPTTTWRRHTDPPGLWTKVLAGSVIVHLLLLVSLRWLVVRIATPPSGTREIAIELIEATESASETETTNDDAPSSELSSSAVAEASGDPLVGPNDAIAIAPDSPLEPQNSVIPEPAPNPSTTTAPTPNPEPLPLRDRSDTLPLNPLGQPPSTNPIPEPVSPVNPTPTTPAPTPPIAPPPSEPQNPEGAIATPPANPENGGIPTLPGTPLPEPPVPADLGEAAPPAGVDNSSVPIGEVPVAAEATPVGFTANLINVSLPTDVPDVPAYAAQPQVSSQQFLADAVISACLLTPESASYLGQSVALRIAVDDQGRVLGEATQVRQSSGSGTYDQLAACVLNGWEFSPAFNRTDSGDSPVFSNLDVTLTINPL